MWDIGTNRPRHLLMSKDGATCLRNASLAEVANAGAESQVLARGVRWLAYSWAEGLPALATMAAAGSVGLAGSSVCKKVCEEKSEDIRCQMIL